MSLSKLEKLGKLEKEFMVLPAYADYTGRMGIFGFLNACMDIATEHAEMLHIGYSTLKPENKYWIVVKNKLVFDSYVLPEIGEMVKLETWPEKSRGIKCNRYCRLIDSKGNVLARSKTLWTISNLTTGRPERVELIYPSDLEFIDDATIEEDFSNIVVSSENKVGEYIVKSTDVDAGNHMNNVKYLMALHSLYDLDCIKNIKIRSIEVQYKVPVHEKDKICFYLDKDNNTLNYKGVVNDNECVLIKVVCE